MLSVTQTTDHFAIVDAAGTLTAGDYDRFEAGDVAWLHRNGACFVVEDVDEANRRAADFELSPTGPLPGPKMLRAEGDQGAPWP